MISLYLQLFNNILCFRLILFSLDVCDRVPSDPTKFVFPCEAQGMGFCEWKSRIRHGRVCAKLALDLLQPTILTVIERPELDEGEDYTCEDISA